MGESGKGVSDHAGRHDDHQQDRRGQGKAERPFRSLVENGEDQRRDHENRRGRRPDRDEPQRHATPGSIPAAVHRADPCPTVKGGIGEGEEEDGAAHGGRVGDWRGVVEFGGLECKLVLQFREALFEYDIGLNISFF